MTILERYLFRTGFFAFALCMVALTAIIWLSSALRELSLVTSKGQTILVFLYMTLLSIPALLMLIVPIALFAGTIYVLNKFNSDSELIVMSAAGAPPWRIARPFIALALFATAIVAYVTIIAMPTTYRTMRDLLSKIRADIVTKIVQEGKFVSLDSGITFHYKSKSGDALLGLLIQDRRDTNKISTYIADRGQVVDLSGTAFMILEKGSIHRQTPGAKDNAMIAFDRYALDLDQVSGEGEATIYKPRERSTWALLSQDVNEPYYKLQAGRFRAELHDRFANTLYPFACLAIAFAALGAPRTTRQGRGFAIGLAIAAMMGMRWAGFYASTQSARSPGAALLVYAVPLSAVIGGLIISMRQQAGKSVVPRAFGLAAEALASKLKDPALLPAFLRRKILPAQ